MKKPLFQLFIYLCLALSGVLSAQAETKKILVVGNSFSFDATLQELLPIVQSEGDDIVLGFPYKGGTTLELHWKYMTNNQKIYNYYKISGGQTTSTGGSSRCFDPALIASEPWDIVVIQTDHNYSGVYSHYFPYLDNIIDYIRTNLTNKDARFYLYMTWAYQDGSPKMAELVNKNLYTDQADQYAKILDCARRAADQSGIGVENVIPAGTAVQNGRTSYIGDSYNRDGYHMDLNHGRYTVALTWYEKIFGKSALDVRYKPESISDFCASMCRRAAHEAIATPWQVTSLEEDYGVNLDFKYHPLDRPVVVNFGMPVANSDESEYTWNDMTSPAKGATISSLYNIKGYITDLSLTSNEAFGGVGIGGSTESDTPLHMPADASRSTFHGTGQNTITISGLYPGQAYDITLYASAENACATIYTLSGTNTATATVEPSTPGRDIATAKNITATESGRITLEIAAETDGERHHTGAMMITPHMQVPGKMAVNINFTDGSQSGDIAGWNSVTSPAKDTAVASLLTADGKDSGISLRVTDAFAGFFAEGPERTNTSMEMPADVSTTGYWVNGATKDGILDSRAEIVFSGLNPAETYDFEMFGAIDGATEIHEAEYSTFGDADNFIALNCNDNRSDIAVIPAVRPDSNGEVRFTVTPGATSADTYRMAYLNAMTIKVPTMVEVVPFEPVAEGPWDGKSLIEPTQDINGNYIIYSGAELAWIADRVNKGTVISGVRLAADIDLGNQPWTPIGYGKFFTGSIEGNGHRITNLYINRTDFDNDKKFCGLVGGTNSKDCNIRDIRLSGRIEVPTAITAKTQVGSFIGKANTLGEISNCHSDVEITVAGKAGYAGGVVGFMKNALVKSCSFSGTIIITGTIANGAGGIIGTTNSSMAGIEAECHGCYFTGSIINKSGKTLKYVAGINSLSGLKIAAETTTYNYVAGTIDCDAENRGVIYASSNTQTFFCDDNYYLEGYSMPDKGGIAADAARFHSGEIAYLLNGDQMEFLFGQDIADPESMPVAYNGANRVFRTTFVADGHTYATLYSNSQLRLPEGPHEDTIWEDENGNTYDSSSIISSDMELYAKPISSLDEAAAKLPSISIRGDKACIDSPEAIGRVAIYAADGRTMATSDHSDNHCTIDLAGLSRGIYLIECGGSVARFCR